MDIAVSQKGEPMSLMTFLSEFGFMLCGMFAMGIVWFISDNGENSPYSRGFKDGYNVAKMETEERTDEDD